MLNSNPTFIYKIVNTRNGNVYIGITTRKNPYTRFTEHKNCSKKPHNTNQLYQAMRKHGIDNFRFEIIYCSMDRYYAFKIMEPYFIKEYNSYSSGYNMTDNNDGFQYGIENPSFSTTCKRRMIQNNPMKNPEIVKKAMESRLINGNSLRGRKRSSAVCEKLSKSKTGENNPNYGNKDASKHLNSIRLTCPHCRKETNKGNARRWHFENCKSLQS